MKQRKKHEEQEERKEEKRQSIESNDNKCKEKLGKNSFNIGFWNVLGVNTRDKEFLEYFDCISLIETWLEISGKKRSVAKSL